MTFTGSLPFPVTTLQARTHGGRLKLRKSDRKGILKAGLYLVWEKM